MKYWGLLLVKIAAALTFMWELNRAVRLGIRWWVAAIGNPYMRGLANTMGSMILWLIFFGLVYLVIWDQRYRCRTCLRRLRMPVTAGSWPNMMLKGQPRTEYICVYGHGTLKMPEVDLTGSKRPDWEPHTDDIWKELESLGEKR